MCAASSKLRRQSERCGTLRKRSDHLAYRYLSRNRNKSDTVGNEPLISHITHRYRSTHRSLLLIGVSYELRPIVSSPQRNNGRYAVASPASIASRFSPPVLCFLCTSRDNAARSESNPPQVKSSVGHSATVHNQERRIVTSVSCRSASSRRHAHRGGTEGSRGQLWREEGYEVNDEGDNTRQD
ncbi:hypothetical protein DMN91_003076 [Ooceraea biroi]|uniref:Uncharacterized protein n=1 Tax=Ooceraea biroi TaxID=2015173 RepID=A0A3L8DWY5_OOCBI|nr:hypothetical protein DMN91_003076 [Ooceraea biroi]